VTLIAIALTLGVATYGLMTDRRSVALSGLLASMTIAVAMVLRARDSVRAAELSSELLDSALADSERARAELNAANERLQRTNVDLRTLRIAVAQGFNLIDERTQGRLREVVEHAGDDLAALVEESLDD
jgi:biopolymer transport protein ExbB/TolQ